MRRILVADIGGTSSRFASFIETQGLLTRQDSLWLSTESAKSLPELLDVVRNSSIDLRPEAADICVFAVAGAVRRRVYADPPNIPFDIDLSDPGLLNLPPSLLINDFLAQAFACKTQAVADVLTVLPGSPQPEGMTGVIGAGTGLGKAMLADLGHGRYEAFPSEGGHASLPVEREEEVELWRFVRRELCVDFPELEMLVAGRGLSLVHRYLTGDDLDPAEVAEHLTPENPTLILMSRLYARACRNFALEILSLGGLYVTGGIAAKNPNLLINPHFSAEFLAHPVDVYRRLLATIPVWLNTNEESGLWGAALYGALAL